MDTLTLSGRALERIDALRSERDSMFDALRNIERVNASGVGLTVGVVMKVEETVYEPPLRLPRM